MDIENLVKSNIKREWNLYKITLPSIEGFCESVFYNHEWVTMDYLSSNFSDKLSFSKINGDLHHIFLMSSICDAIFIRIIDTLDFYNDTFLIIHSWNISSFNIKGRTYFVIIYEDTSHEVKFFTNFINEPIFKANFENNEFNIFNILTGMSVYNCSYYIPENNTPENQEKEPEQWECTQAMILDDILFPKKQEILKVKNFFLSKIKKTSISIENSELLKNSFRIQYIYNSTDQFTEWEKLIGFLGTHQCILENPWKMNRYISLWELTDLDVNMPESFMPSWKIDSLDPGWHKLRKTLMELQYLTHSIQIHIWSLKWSIDSIDILNSPFLNLQKDHSTMTLMDLEKIEKTYTIYLTTLIALLQNSLP